LASLDRSEEADKWLFDAGWKKRSIFGVRGFIPLTVRRVITHPEYFTYYKNIPIKVNYKRMMR
jgi:pyrimidine-specific ribonucleoside hydrolase